MGKRRRGYFKHYNDSTFGSSIGQLMFEREYLSVCLFWHFLELCNQENNEEINGLCLKKLAAQTGTKPKMILRSCGAIDRLVAAFSFTSNGHQMDLKLANYSEYQDTRSTNNPRKCHDTAHIKDNRLKIKDNRYSNIVSSVDKPTSSPPLNLKKEIEVIYDDYPRKIGKTKGMQKLVKEIKTLEQVEFLRAAVTNYKSYASQSDPKFIKHFSTFVSEWKDWIERVEYVNGAVKPKEIWVE